MRTESTKRLFTVDEYYRMAEVGILSSETHTELINGEIIEMSPMGARHAAAVSRVNDRLVRVFSGKALLRPQLPLRLDQYNEPQPAITLLRPRPDYYESRHPGHADALLVFEISDSSLDYDRDVKKAVYASARIPEFWILDLKDSLLLVFRDPARGDYKTFLHFRRGDAVSPLSFPGMFIAVSDLLGAASE
jgi:Uma2 family endonuclease